MRLDLWEEMGFTLMEIILAILISFILLSSIGRFFGFNLNLFNHIGDMADNQSELRFIMEDLERVVGTSTEVVLLHDQESPEEVDKTYIYVEGGGSETDGVVVRKSNGTVTSFGGASGINGLALTFKIKSAARPNIVVVEMRAADGMSMTQEIYLQNAGAASAEEEGPYPIVRLVPLEP